MPCYIQCWSFFIISSKEKQTAIPFWFTIIAPENIYGDHSTIMAENILGWKIFFILQILCERERERENPFTV